MPIIVRLRKCKCGCPKGPHEHYRRGQDAECAMCGPYRCTRYRRVFQWKIVWKES
jgi:hypothetical protein